MAEPSQTPNLKVPRILGADLVMREKINEAIDKIDTVVLPATHEASKAHFETWKANQTYRKQDVVKTSACPSWGFYMCDTAGTSTGTEPQGYGEGDVVSDGSCVWILKSLAGGVKNHGDLTGRQLPSQHPIAAITNLQTELDKRVDKVTGKDLSTNDYDNIDKGKVDNLTVTVPTDIDQLRNNSHAHQNKNELDKIGEKGGKLTYDNKAIIGGASTWSTAMNYEVDELAVVDGILYRCIAIHTSTSFQKDIASWEQLMIGYIPVWQPSIRYILHQVVTNEDKILRCLIPHTSRVACDVKELAFWDVLSHSKIIINDWQSNTNYEVKEFIVYTNKIYRCNRNHNSGTKFKAVYWDLLSSMNANQYMQHEERNVTAPYEIEIPINYTTTFCLPQVNVLKYNPTGGAQGQLISIEKFDNGNAGNFIIDGQNAELASEYIFDGVMKINTEYEVKVNAPQNLLNDTLCETEYIDFSAYKKIEDIRGGFL